MQRINRKDGVMYSIDAINSFGTFYLELIGVKQHADSKRFVFGGEVIECVSIFYSSEF